MTWGVLGLAATAWGQDIISVYGIYQPPAGIEAEQFDIDVDARFTAFGGSVLTPPIRLFDDHLLWINGASFRRIVPAFTSQVELPDDIDNRMNSVTLDVLLIASFTERWSAAVSLVPGLHSNFAASLSGEDFRLQVAGLALYEFDERTSVGLGLSYSNLFGVPLGFPVAQATLERDRWRLDALLPERLVLWGEIVDDRLSIGAKGSFVGGYFHRATNDPALPSNTFIRYSLGSAGPALQGRFGPLVLTAETGWTFYRRFDIYLDDTPLVDFDLENGFTGRLTLALSPSRKSSDDDTSRAGSPP